MIKKSRTHTRFTQLSLEPGNTERVPFQLTVGNLKTIPIDGGIEYDGNRFYGTLSNTVRKSFAFMEDVEQQKPEYFYSISKKNNDNTYSMTNPVGNVFNANNLLKLSTFDATGTTTGKIFTRTVGTWTANALVGYKAKLINGGAVYYREIIANTVNELFFKRDIPSATSVEIFHDNVIDDNISVNSNLREIFFDGNNYYICYTSFISKIDPITLDKKDFVIGSNNYSFGFDGINIWCIGDNATPIKRFNINTETFDTLSINGVSSTFGYCVTVGKFIYAFHVSVAYKYDVELLTRTILNIPTNINGQMISVNTFPNTDFIYFSGVNNTGVTELMYKYSITNDSAVLVLNSPVNSINPLRFSSFDGLNMYALKGNKVARLSKDLDYQIVATVPFTFLSNVAFDGQNLVGYGYNQSNVYGLGYINPSTLTLTNFSPMDREINGDWHLIYSDRNMICILNNILFKLKTIGQNKARHELIKSRNASQIGSYRLNTNFIIDPLIYLSLNDSIVFVDTSTLRVLYLPDATKCLGQVITIKDNTGNASTNPITINTILSQNIDGSLITSINSNYGVLRLISNGTNWRLI